MAVQIESDKVAGVRREIAEVDAQLARAERLLKIADPDGCAAPAINCGALLGQASVLPCWEGSISSFSSVSERSWEPSLAGH